MEILYSQEKEVYGAELEGEICLFDSKSAKYFILNSTGSAIWEIIDKPKSFQEIKKILLETYDMQNIEYEKDIKTFLNEGLSSGLITALNDSK